MTIGASDWTGQSLSGGRYRINAKLGEGGMGTVYRATDRNIEAEVVIKAPLRSMLADPEFARRFKDEIRSLVRLSHPHIVKLSDVGDWDGLPFAVMQYLPGGSLEDRKPAGPDGTFGAHDPREVGRWLGKVAEALDYVHSQGYVHRDVKPGNILFDGQGHPFLGDFGVVKVLTSDAGSKPSKTMTGAGMVVGTAEYMAPELIMGEPFDGKVDQYALAVTVFEILSGRRPFEDAATTKVLVLQTTKNPPRLDELRGWLPASVSDAVLKGLAKEPGERYATCLAFANAVTEAIAGAFEGQPERVRFLCGSCSRVLSLPPASHEKMVQTGKSVPCPGCQTPFQIPRGGEATTAGGVTRREGTLVEISLAEPDESPRRGTMIEPAAGFPLAQVPPIPGSPTLIEQPGLKRPAATLVEQPGLRRAPATMIEQPGLRSGLPGMPAIDTAPRESAPAPKPAPGPPIPLIAAGAGESPSSPPSCCSPSARWRARRPRRPSPRPRPPW
ncbi:serine/threonine protein kinase [Singulisphaera sp. PoT]|uniref:serine/threonine protein kinase n=1 Tax=Singulisphaera sp. PoT TaxID=3411797 RepID=UPI003BF55FA7